MPFFVFQFFFTKIFKLNKRDKDGLGVELAEAGEYDEIFTALKHPVRRQILLFIEQKGEASFTQIQQETGIRDTGLMSYHLKELAPLIEQSKRGKYCLSEVGQAGVELFRKVERERQKSSVVVRNEVEKVLADSIKRSVFLLGIVGLTLLVPIMYRYSVVSSRDSWQWLLKPSACWHVSGKQSCDDCRRFPCLCCMIDITTPKTLRKQPHSLYCLRHRRFCNVKPDFLQHLLLLIKLL